MHNTKKKRNIKSLNSKFSKNKRTFKNIQSKKTNNKTHLPQWMIERGIAKHIYYHEKYKNYNSILKPLLFWEEIEKEIINNYIPPKKYIMTDKNINILNANNNSDINNNIDKIINKQIENYNTMTKKDLIDTLKFLFNNFKEYLFFSIRNNKIKSYYIYNKEATNKWANDLRFVEENGQINPDFDDYYISYLKRTGKYQKNNPLLPKDKWYANNCILATNDWKELPTSYVAQIQNMIEEVGKIYDLPDCDLIINRKDFSILNLDKSPAHGVLYSKNKKMTEQPDNPWIICSQNKTKNNYDICIPNADEWDFINKLENDKNNKNSKNSKNNNKVNHNWNSKKSIGVFRGGATGCSTNISTNPRLKLSAISNEWNDKTNEKNKEKHGFIDVGIVVPNNKLTTKMKINDQIVTYLSKSPIKLAQRMEYNEQSNYKYVFYVQGNASAYRLSNMFYMNSVVVYIDTPFYQWFEPLLIKNKHIVKIKENFTSTDIYREIKKLKNNDEKAQKIAENGMDFFEQYINKNTILKYWCKLFIKINELQS